MALKVDLADAGPMIFTFDAIYLGDSHGPPAAIVNDLSQWYASAVVAAPVAGRPLHLNLGNLREAP
jgi:hypothetical protein